MNKELRKLLNSEDFSLKETENEIYVYVGNTCGEDFFICVNKSNTKQEIEDLINECELYDTEEHFKLWYGANRGEPQGVKELYDNCEEIGEKLGELMYKLKQFL